MSKEKDELIKLLEDQIIDLTIMSKIELGDDVIKEFARLKTLIRQNDEEKRNG